MILKVILCSFLVQIVNEYDWTINPIIYITQYLKSNLSIAYSVVLQYLVDIYDQRPAPYTCLLFLKTMFHTHRVMLNELLLGILIWLEDRYITYAASDES